MLRLGLMLTIVTVTTIVVAYALDKLRDETVSTSLALAGIAVVVLIWLCMFVASVFRKALRLRTKPARWGSDK